MQEHVHTGPIMFLYVGISAIIFIQLVRLGSAQLVKQGGVFEQVGTVTGALVHFG